MIKGKTVISDFVQSAFRSLIAKTQVSRMNFKYVLLTGPLAFMFVGALHGQGFVTTWETTGSNESITIPTNANQLGYSYSINWGDGTTDNAIYTTDATHQYNNPGIYAVEISGTFPSIYFNDSGDKDKILSIEQWGNISWTTMERAFYGCTNIVSNATDAPDLSIVTNTSWMFLNATSFDGDLNNWDVSNVTNMSWMFNGAKAFNGNLSGWDVSSVTTMFLMFGNASSFNQNIGGWDVSNVTDMTSMLFGTSSFNQDISGWNVSNVTSMYYLFRGASVFNADISGWEVSKVTDMNSMFFGAVAFDQDLSSWDVSQVTVMTDMFRNAFAFDQDLGAWNVMSVADMTRMLDLCGQSQANYDATLIGWASLPSLQSGVPLGASELVYCDAFAARNSLISNNGWIISGDEECPSQGFITTWQTTSTNESITIPKNTALSNYSYTVDWGDGSTDNTVYTGDASHTYATAGVYTVDIGGTFPSIEFNNSGDKDKILSIDQWGNIAWESMEHAFYGCGNLTYNASDVPDLSSVGSLSSTFREASSFNGDLNDWDVSNVTTMVGTFQDATSFNGAVGDWDVSGVVLMLSTFNGASSFNQDISNWDVSSVARTEDMFRDAPVFNADLSGWNTSNIFNMSGMFTNAAAFNQDIGGWDVSSVNDMRQMFANATDFNQELNGWDVGMVTDMFFMFSGATAFDQDLSSWDVSNVTTMVAMFWNTPFNQDLSGWNVENVADMNQMFGNAAAFDQSLGAWDINSVTNMTDMLDNTSLSTANYDATLTGWANVSGLQSNVVLGANGLTYCTSSSDRANLIANLSWSISGDTQANCSEIAVLDFEQREIEQTAAINFGTTPEGATKDQEFTIKNNGFSPLKIEEISVSGNGFTNIGDTPSIVEANDKASFILRMSADVEGSLDATVTIKSDNLEIPEFNFSVTGEVVKVLRVEQIEDLVIYPNPVSDKLQLSFAGKDLSNVSINVQTLSGQKVIQIENSEMENQLLIPISQLQSATYLLEIKTGDRITRRRFIKN